jgi:hypothetical protein
MLLQESEKEERKTNGIEFFHIHIIAQLLYLSHEKHVQQFGVHHQRKGALGANTPCKVQTCHAPQTMHLKQPNAHPPCCCLIFGSMTHSRFNVCGLGCQSQTWSKFNVCGHGFS